MAEIKIKAAEIAADRRKGMKTPIYAPAGQSTQMIIGATPTPDRDILATSDDLYKKYKLRRVYYSAFSPSPHADARLPGQSPPLIREHRLYQADWLLRFYDFAREEIVNDAHPDLALDMDPKTAWALRNRAYFPIDVNTGSREQLLRIPGVGERSVHKMLKIRRYSRLRLDDLARLRVALNRARPFIVTADYDSSALMLDSENLKARLVKPAPQLELAL